MSATSATPQVSATPRAPERRRRRRWVALGLLFALPLAMALAVERAPAAPYEPPPLPPALAARFAYPEQGTPAPVEVEFSPSRGWGYQSRWLKLSVTRPGDPQGSHYVQLIHYRSARPGPRPAVLITPIHGGRQPVARVLAPMLARRGIDAAIVLRGERYFEYTEPPAALERILRTAVLDRRRALDWLEREPELDPGRIGAIGVSMGGVVTATLLGVEPRIQAAVIALGGAGLDEIVLESVESDAREYVSERLRRAGGTRAELQAQLAAALICGPEALAPYRRAEVLQVLARRDRSVPYANQRALWEALGRPARIELPTGHLSSGLYAPWLLDACLDWLEARLRR